jgi:hypothetical protein
MKVCNISKVRSKWVRLFYSATVVALYDEVFSVLIQPVGDSFVVIGGKQLVEG